jgi:hypothetical protein
MELKESHLSSFSMDLVAAVLFSNLFIFIAFSDHLGQVLRQITSNKVMLMSIKQHGGSYDAWIINAITRYGQFMRLPEHPFRPPVDVDIIWHTHQLDGTKYWLVILFFNAC